MKWTKPQAHAITYNENKNVLISAAAGSGKTAVLVERIISRILDEHNPISVDDILVLTFTNAAAAEMKNKIQTAIQKKLKEFPDNKHLKKQTMKIASADISTVHAFSQKLIKNNIHKTNIPTDFSIIDEVENKMLLDSALNECLERYYKRIDKIQSFSELTLGHGGIKNDSNLRDIVCDIYNFSRSLATPTKWLNDSVKLYKDVAEQKSISGTKFESAFLNCIKDIIRKMLEYYSVIENNLNNYFDSEHKLVDFFKIETTMLKKFLDINSIREYFKLRGTLKFATIKGLSKEEKGDAYLVALYEDIKNLRNTAKPLIQKNQLFLYESEEHVCTSIIALYPRIKTLKNIVLMLNRRHTRLKLQNSTLDFGDLEHNLISLIMNSDGTPTTFCEKLSQKYKEIYVDEYQDTNNIQDTLFKLISGNQGNIFMVGDLKQSIYKFRNASPKLFLDKYEDYEKSDKNGHLITLSDNFRSRKTVVDTVNYVFTTIMFRESAEIDYTENERLNCGASYPEPDDQENVYKTEMLMTDVISEESTGESGDTTFKNKTELEARTVAERIVKLVCEEKIPILDSKTGDTRPIEFGDIVILMSSIKNAAPVFEQILMDYGIPVSSDVGSGFLDTVEVRTVLSFLDIINNPLQDIPLIAVMRSPIFGFTADELADIRTMSKRVNFFHCVKLAADSGNRKSKAFFDCLSKMREYRKYMGIDEIIYKICYDLNYLAVVGSMKGGEIRKTNLKLLLQRAGDYEKRALKGLFNFVEYLKKINNDTKAMPKSKNVGNAQSAVSITTIHKSKGLEYPVVILANTTKGNKSSGNMLFDEEYGIALPFVDTEKRIRYSAMPLDIIKYNKQKELRAESMRLLYVALTRAKEKLIISCTNAKIKNSNRWKKPLLDSDGRVLKSYIEDVSGFRDWLVCAFLSHENADSLRDIMETDISEIFMEKDHVPFEFKLIKHSDTEEKNSMASVNISETRDNTIGVQKDTETVPLTDEQKQKIRAILSYKYPHMNLTKIPLKLSVSEIKRAKSITEPEQDGEYTPVLNSVADRSFKTVKIADAAEIGTITHYIIQHIDPEFAQAESDIIRQMNSFVANGIISQSQLDCVDKNLITGFFLSDTGKRIRSAHKAGLLEREFKMLFPVDASSIYSELENTDDKDAQIIIQGIADCFFVEDDEIVLIDYKTDSISGDNAYNQAEKYRIQIEYYTQGLESILGKRVKERILYFLKPGISIKI